MDASQRLIFSWDDADQADEELRKKEEAELFKMHKQMQLRKLQADGLAKQVEAAEEERRLQLCHNNSCLGCIVCAPSCTKYACTTPHHSADVLTPKRRAVRRHKMNPSRRRRAREGASSI